MLKLAGLAIACIVLATPSMADRVEETRRLWLVIPGCVDAADETRCIDAALEQFAPCKGTVEERLACLDRKVAMQAEAILALRRKLDERTLPRVNPLAGGR